MFKREIAGGKLLGYSLLHKDAFFFFGSRYLSREELCRNFPEYECSFIRQVHGSRIVEAKPPEEPEADAHWTRMATRALVIQTADCVPLLLASKYQVCAIHVGWKGIAQNIVEACRSSFTDDPVLFAAIGPHIQRSSFEVGVDVADQLVDSLPRGYPSDGITTVHEDASKKYVDLNAIVKAQLGDTFGPRVRIFECIHDTLTSAEFHSFRRDRGHAGRQYSFVVLNS